MQAVILSLFAVIGLVSAHFAVEYPAWRSDSLAENTTYSQWDYPCAGVPYGAGNKTEWPLEGGSVVLDLHHPWTYLYINLGLGENATNFNISLTPQLLNVTGSGNFCIPALSIPAAVADGQEASLQVVTNGESGSALYNCADIVFKSSAKPLSGGICTNSTGVTAAIVGQAATTNSSSTPTPTPTPNGALTVVSGGAQTIVMSVAFGFVLIMVM
ncbi:hypothetical protein FHL15_004136 [Xylaria flabelliformis]|uniref:Copper acquisition factor BIM1-like domain-containing protein n=1 Tax=Xylaria flabelliformis TaxID=2512241 RepID=A0A553I4E1_9PEZI|nr:hypothetical protein FHL15_004136 [Xylaria flabelliformis]